MTRSDAMTEAKRQLNTQKHQRVAAVIQQIRDQGRDDELRPTIVARRAGVHRSFVTKHFASHLDLARADIQARFVAGLTGQTALTAASLRVEAETAKQQLRDAQAENLRLKRKLASALGAEVADEMQDARAETGTTKDLREHVELLLANEVDLRRQVRDLEEELDAARRLNRTLMREQNAGSAT